MSKDGVTDGGFVKLVGVMQRTVDALSGHQRQGKRIEIVTHELDGIEEQPTVEEDYWADSHYQVFDPDDIDTCGRWPGTV